MLLILKKHPLEMHISSYFQEKQWLIQYFSLHQVLEAKDNKPEIVLTIVESGHLLVLQGQESLVSRVGYCFFLIDFSVWTQHTTKITHSFLDPGTPYILWLWFIIGWNKTIKKSDMSNKKKRFEFWLPLNFFP